MKKFNEEKFNIYSYGCDLKSGDNIKIDISISPKRELLKNEVGELIKKNSLQGNLNKLKEEELQVYNELLESMNKWIDKAKEIKMYEMALSYNGIKEVDHTYNEWFEKKDGGWITISISNRVYNMWFKVYVNEDYRTKKVTYEVSYHVYMNKYDSCYYKGWSSKTIARQERKKFTDEEKMNKYIEGRKKTFSHLFQEVNPAIPKEYESLFTVNGVLLPDYKIEE
jgi:hypothetical protein